MLYSQIAYTEISFWNKLFTPSRAVNVGVSTYPIRHLRLRPVGSVSGACDCRLQLAVFTPEEQHPRRRVVLR